MQKNKINYEGTETEERKKKNRIQYQKKKYLVGNYSFMTPIKKPKFRNPTPNIQFWSKRSALLHVLICNYIPPWLILEFSSKTLTMTST